MTKEKRVLETEQNICCAECGGTKTLFARLAEASVKDGARAEDRSNTRLLAEHADLFGWIPGGYELDDNPIFYCSEVCAFRD